MFAFESACLFPNMGQYFQTNAMRWSSSIIVKFLLFILFEFTFIVFVALILHFIINKLKINVCLETKKVQMHKIKRSTEWLKPEVIEKTQNIQEKGRNMQGISYSFIIYFVFKMKIVQILQRCLVSSNGYVTNGCISIVIVPQCN